MIRYNIYFAGQITAEYTEEEVRENACNYLELQRNAVDYMFDGEEHLIKSGLLQSEALFLIAELHTIGMDCVFDVIKDTITLPDGNVIQERRVHERRQFIRRGNIRNGLGSDLRLQNRRQDPST